MAEILLEDIEFFAYHGVYPDEKKNGNRFLVNIKVTGSWDQSAKTDELKHALDYTKLYDLLEKEILKPSCLLENVVYRINKRIIKELKSVDSVETKLCKLNPPIQGNINRVCVKDKLNR